MPLAAPTCAPTRNLSPGVRVKSAVAKVEAGMFVLGLVVLRRLSKMREAYLVFY